MFLNGFGRMMLRCMRSGCCELKEGQSDARHVACARGVQAVCVTFPCRLALTNKLHTQVLFIDSAYWAAAAVGGDRLLCALVSAKKCKKLCDLLISMRVDVYVSATHIA